MNKLRNERTQELRNLLIRLREDLRARVRAFRHDQEQEALSTPGDEMDVAKSLMDVETHASLIERSEDQLLKIDDALTRLDEGTYGVCMNCGEEIPVERLKAVPFALYCVDCQSKLGGAPGLSPTEQKLYRRWTPPKEADEKEFLSDNRPDNPADELEERETLGPDDEAESESQPSQVSRRTRGRRPGRPRQAHRKTGRAG